MEMGGKKNNVKCTSINAEDLNNHETRGWCAFRAPKAKPHEISVVKI